MRTLQVEAAAARELRVARLAFEPRTGRFDVTFELPGSAVARRLPLRFTGSLMETFEALVPARAIAKGEVLKASDFTARAPAQDRIRRQRHHRPPSRRRALPPAGPLRAGQVIRHADLMKPELVGRNETVTITYEVPGILLTMRGQALEAGARGDVINVLNIQSKRTVQATVIGPGRVSVTAASAVAAQARCPPRPIPKQPHAGMCKPQ